jgi:hypothetical protein
MGIHTVGAELFHEEKPDKLDKANGPFSQFCESN